jgi:hypothetical protein
MSKADLPDPSKCDHEYSEPHPPFSVCCRCKKWRLPSVSRTSRSNPHMNEIPDHWFKHSIHQISSTVQELASDMRTGADVLDGDFPPDAEHRHVQICGSCGHWLSAVHGGYFDRDGVDDQFADSPFAGSLRESLCPKCGTVLFRWTILVASLSSARRLSDTDIQQYLIMRGCCDYWKADQSTRLGDGYIDTTKHRLRSVISRITSTDDLMPRCPACARPGPKCRAEFDFHHWDYDSDIGCRLCRWCHNHIHRGMKARKQEELTDGWRADAERRLLNHCQDNGLRFDSVRDFQRRFNIPNVAMNTEIRADMRPVAVADYPVTPARETTAPEVPPEVRPDE